MAVPIAVTLGKPATMAWKDGPPTTTPALTSALPLFDGDHSTGLTLSSTGGSTIEFTYDSVVTLTAINIVALRTSIYNKCNPDGTDPYQPPTALTLWSKAEGEDWRAIQEWSAYEADGYSNLLHYCCSAESVAHGEPGCGRANEDADRAHDSQRLPLTTGLGVQADTFALHITRSLGDTWVKSVQPSLGEVLRWQNNRRGPLKTGLCVV